MSKAVSFREIVKEKKRTGGPCELSLAEYVRPFAASGEEITVSGKGTSMLPTITEECTLVMAPLPKSGARGRYPAVCPARRPAGDPPRLARDGARL